MQKPNNLYLHAASGGTYEVLEATAHVEAEGLSGPLMVVYRDYPEGNHTWVRPRDEFFDGRFQRVGTVPKVEVFTPLDDIVEFHEKYELEGLSPMGALDPSTMDFRHKFMQEELHEWLKNQCAAYDETTRPLIDRDPANYAHHLEETLDGLVDLMYVLLGTAYLHGFQEVFAEAWNRVHAANMTKVRAALDGSDSKRGTSLDVVKPAGWEKPVHTDLVECNDIHLAHSGRA